MQIHNHTITALGYALLGMLARGPASGYDLGREMQRSIGFYWRARHSQIYPELARLAAQQVVTYDVVVQQEVPSKKVYTITDAGRAALKQWVVTPPDLPIIRDELVLRALSLWLVDAAAAHAVFRQHEEQHQAQLALYEQREHDLHTASGAALDDPTSPEFGVYATLRAGISYERMYIEWCRWMQQQLARVPPVEGPPQEHPTIG